MLIIVFSSVHVLGYSGVELNSRTFDSGVQCLRRLRMGGFRVQHVLFVWQGCTIRTQALTARLVRPPGSLAKLLMLPAWMPQKY